MTITHIQVSWETIANIYVTFTFYICKKNIWGTTFFIMVTIAISDNIQYKKQKCITIMCALPDICNNFKLQISN